MGRCTLHPKCITLSVSAPNGRKIRLAQGARGEGFPSQVGTLESRGIYKAVVVYSPPLVPALAANRSTSERSITTMSPGLSLGRRDATTLSI